MSGKSTPLNEILGRENGQKVPDRVLDELCELIHQETGLALDKKKYRMRLRRKIKRQMREHNIDDPNEYLARIRSKSRKEIRHLIEAVVVNETLVYRYPHQMKWLSESFFPDVLENPPRTLRILSAGCSTGAEPYSAAIALAEALRKRGIQPEDVSFDIRILGIDISDNALAQAREGLYGSRPVQNAPDEIQERYFQQVNDREYKVHPTLQDWTRFRKGNLLKCSLPSENDLVLIRNVLIYFQQSERRQILQRLYRQMSRQAPLIVGHAEDLSEFSQWFHPHENSARGIYEHWTTDRNERNETSFGESESSDSVAPSQSSDPDDTSEPKVEVYCSGGDRTCVYLEGTLGENISTERFRTKILEQLESYQPEEECFFDLRDVDYFSNEHIGVFRDTLETCLDEGHRVTIATDNEELRKDMDKLFDSPWINVVTEFESCEPDKIMDDLYDDDLSTTNGTKKAQDPTPSATNSEPTNEKRASDSTEEATDEPHLDLQILPEGLLFQLSGDWSQDHCPRELSILLRHWIEQFQPDHVRILLTRVEGWDRGVAKVLSRLDSVGSDIYESLDVITDDPSLATRLRKDDIPVRFESSIEELVP